MIGKTVFHYRILEKLGEGGMGVVYKALDLKLERHVALKFLPHEISIGEEDRARFLQEARAASAISHANVCVIHDIAEHDGQQFIVMEYVDGKTLGQMAPIKKVQDALGYAIQVGEALEAAHAKGVVHRDVKTDNIMVNAGNQAKVMDFGLAKLRGSLKLTKTTSTVGTLSYMAPEQIQGGEVDARSDIFSFGVVLYEMLTGHLPFVGEHEAAVMYSIVNDSPQPIQKHRPDLSSELLHIINRALEKDPEERYQNVHDMVIDLRRAKKETSRVSRSAIMPSATGQTGPNVFREGEAPVAATVAASRKEIMKGGVARRLRLFGVMGLAIAATAVALFVLLPERPPRLNPDMSFRTLDTPFTEIDFMGLSRDGGWVAFSARDAKREWSVYFMNVAKGEPRRLVTEQYTRFDYTEISPDNSEVLFGASKSGLLTAVYVVSSAGGTSRKVVEPGIGARWRPDGQLIGYIKDGSPAAPSRSGKFEFWTVRPDGSDNRLVFVDSMSFLASYCFDWSPQGDRIAWLRSLPGYGEIFIRDLDSGRERQLTHYRKPITEIAWASNNQIFFTSSRTGYTNVWMIPAGGGEAVQVTKGGGADYGVRVSADAKRMLYVQQLKIANVWTAGIDGSGARQLTFDNHPVDNSMFSPDKKHVSFTVFSSDPLLPRTHVFLMEADGTGRTQLTHGDDLYDNATWSPDGRYMTYSSQRPDEPDDSSRVYLADAPNLTAPRLIGRGGRVFWIASDKIVVMSGFPRVRSTLYSATTGEVIEVAADSTCRFPLPDGAHVLIWDLRSGHEGWWLETVGKGGSGELEQILSGDYCFSARASVSLKFLLYGRPDGQLWRVSLPDGRHERMPAVFDGVNPFFLDVQLSHDDKSVVYGKSRLEGRLVLVENLFK